MESSEADKGLERLVRRGERIRAVIKLLRARLASEVAVDKKVPVARRMVAAALRDEAGDDEFDALLDQLLMQLKQMAWWVETDGGHDF